jgi:polyisoprenyl-phosphate glycosyltransferase
MKTLSIVIPCFNSAENIPDLQVALEALSAQLPSYSTEIILVDDGSADDTYQQLLHFAATTPLKLVLVKLTGNFGSYNAFLAGLHHGTGDVYAHMHPDMQDPPEHILAMLPHWENGIPFVIGQRISREDNDSNQLFAKFYHWLMKKIALPHIPDGGYDLIVFDRALRDHVVDMNEKNVNLVYLISWLQYPYVTIPITRVSRKKGKSQWTFRKKSKLFTDSIVAFSYAPVRWLTCSSLLVLAGSVLFSAFLCLSSTFPLSVKITLLFFLVLGNLILIGLSILGEYVWRMLDAGRKRPPFVVEKVTRSATG